MSAWMATGAGALVAYLVHICMQQAARRRTPPDTLAALRRVVGDIQSTTDTSPASVTRAGVSSAGPRPGLRSPGARGPASLDNGGA